MLECKGSRLQRHQSLLPTKVLPRTLTLAIRLCHLRTASVTNSEQICAIKFKQLNKHRTPNLCTDGIVSKLNRTYRQREFCLNYHIENCYKTVLVLAYVVHSSRCKGHGKFQRSYEAQFPCGWILSNTCVSFSL